MQHWNSFAKKLNKNGEKIMYTYMVLDTPKLENNTIKLDFPNQSSKEDFIKRQGNLMAYLRESLQNFELTVEINVTEEVKQKFAFTPEEKFEKLKEINPAIDLMRKLFELELS
ncbi:DNA polymerase III [Flavobacterium agricola]|uniref:DNA polymerase III n=1 Tax=Flavobacterium agricola TaxID=2870839 RepID=A0ABY6M138_9FLAO|nr:DNA polymerase III [Flavobacterium agricola]UYW02219.1 DNA polymerase III [Flavobacterium agricola]